MKIHEILGAKKRNGFRREVSAARIKRIECAERVTRWIPVTAVHVRPQHWARTKFNLIERVSCLRRNAPRGNRITAKRSPLIVRLPVVIQTLRGRSECSYAHSMAKLFRRPSIVSCVFRRKPQVVEIGHSSRQYRRWNSEIAAP